MNLSDLSPKAEPVGWATFTGLALAALASYGFGITPELKALLLFAVPVIAANVWARFQVFAPDTVERIADRKYEEGLLDATTPDVA